MWEYLEPIARNMEVRFLAVVVSSDEAIKQYHSDGYRNAEVHLCSFRELPEVLEQRFDLDQPDARERSQVLRVSQSGLLDTLRLSLPVPQLGHPELASAIKYVERCRRSLDESLFRLFEPTPERWVINGSAGMGKSVLLAYTAAVLCSSHELWNFQGETAVKNATKRMEAIGFSTSVKRGSIVVMAMSAKQLHNIEQWFDFFVPKFQRSDTEGVIRFRRPDFLLCRDNQSFAGGAHWAALLVDEAHDLQPFAAHQVVELYRKGGMYLVVACDRHQKLRLGGANAKVIEGLDFTNKSLRLHQVYRNPAAIYIASLALMFRWFGRDGPKVMPTLADLHEQFGFTAERTQGGEISVTMKTDAHPANSWCHTVATFPDVSSAYAALIQEKVGPREVLWTRFSQEDADFNYELLKQEFTYHNCRSADAEAITNKYIKGQDYPIVVIEGFPRFMDQFGDSDGRPDKDAEARMWAFRRELYLCASRATAFLYIICNVEQTPEVFRIQAELRRLIDSVSMADVRSSGGTKTWRFLIERSAETRKLDVFDDFAAGESIVEDVRVASTKDEVAAPISQLVTRSAPPTPQSQLPTTITPRNLATILGEPPLRMILELKPFVGLVERDQPVDWKYAAELCKRRGFDLVTLWSRHVLP